MRKTADQWGLGNAEGKEAGALVLGSQQGQGSHGWGSCGIREKRMAVFQVVGLREKVLMGSGEGRGQRDLKLWG